MNSFDSKFLLFFIVETACVIRIVLLTRLIAVVPLVQQQYQNMFIIGSNLFPCQSYKTHDRLDLSMCLLGVKTYFLVTDTY